MVTGQAGRICFCRLLEGEDLAETIKKKVEETGIKAGIMLVIGTLKQATLGYYKDGLYENLILEGPLEIASGMGNIATSEKGELIMHMHLVVSNRKGAAFGGHLMKGSPVGATAELTIVEASNLSLIRAFDERTKLNLLKT